MTADNVEIMERLLTAFNGDDVEGVLATFDEDCTIIEPPEVPDTPRDGFRGHDGVRAWMANLRGVGSEWTGRGLGQASEAPIAWTTFIVMHVRRGRILRIQAFLSEVEARTAAGPSE